MENKFFELLREKRERDEMHKELKVQIRSTKSKVFRNCYIWLQKRNNRKRIEVKKALRKEREGIES